MNEKTESEDFEDDEADAAGGDADDNDIEVLISDLSKQKRNSAPQGEPAWRKLEKYREKKQTAELLSDFDDYDIGDPEEGSGESQL
jgi:hypothetical protein